MKKRLLSIVLVFAMIVTLVPNSLVYGEEFGGVSDPIVEGSAAIDILINAGTYSEILAGDLQDKLYDKLKELLEDADVNVRINTPSVDINTNDLSDWYVYDHYDPYHQGDEGTVAPTGAVGQINSSIEYSPTSAWTNRFGSDGSVSDLRPYFKNATSNNFESYTLEKWVNLVQTAKKSTFTVLGDFPYTYGLVGSNSQRGPRVTMLGAFDQHIYSRNGIIDFVGYYSFNYNDFLLFPCASKEEKQVTFDIDSSGVNVHSLSSAGFLINTGIYYKEDDNKKTTPYISGYVLCYEYDGGSSSNYVEDPVPDRISLYPIKNETKAVDFHNNITGSAKSDTLVGKFCGSAIATTQLKDPLGIGTPAGTGSSQKANGAYVTPSLVKTSELCGIEWDSKMNIRMTISPKTLKVEQKPQTSDNWQTVIDVKGDGNQVGSSTTSKTNPVYYSGNPLTSPYNGFGPIVGYTAFGHNCQRASQFTYSNIKMAYIDQTDKIFDLLSGANYIQNADLYFIDLTDDGANRELTNDGNKAAAYMQAKKIRYITNNPNDELLNDIDKTTKTGPLGDNGLWIDSDDYREPVSEEEDADELIDIDKLAKSIADYILAQYKQDVPDYTTILPLSAPVALLSLVRDVDKVTTSYIETVKRELVGNDGLAIFGYDKESKPSDGAKIVSYHYEITDPNGKKVTLTAPTHAAANEKLITIINDKDTWPIGEYTVSLYVTDEKTIKVSDEETKTENKTSSTVTVKFHIVEDITPPLVPSVTINDGKLSFTTSDIEGYGVAKYELICTPVDGGSFIYGSDKYSDPNIPHVINTSVSKITVSSQASPQTLSDIVLPVGEYTAELIVYDMAGNKTVVKLPTIDYVNEDLIGLKPQTVVDESSDPDIIATNGTVDIIDDWMGDNISYTTTNDVNIGNSQNNNEDEKNTTLITINIPSRPKTPGPDADHDPQGMTGIDGYGKIGYVNDTMEYKKSTDSSDAYNPVDENATIINGLDKDSTYDIRYSAKPGESFASLHKEVEIRNNTITGDIEIIGSEDLSNKNLIVEMILKQGNTIVEGIIPSITPTTVSGSSVTLIAGYEIKDVPPGIYNLVVTVIDNDTGEEYVTTTFIIVDGDINKDIIAQAGPKNTLVEIGQNTPDIIAEGLPELMNHTQGNSQQGVTEADLSAVDSDGRLDIVFYAEEFVENDTDRKTQVKALMNSAKEDDRIIGLYLDLSMTKYVWYDGNTASYADADEETILNSTSKLVTVYTPIDSTEITSDKIDDLKIYRYINGTSTELSKDPADGEYFEINNNMVIMHVKNFGEYAVAYQDTNVGPVLININKDDETWSGESAPSIMLKGSGSNQHTITNNTVADIPGGTYSIILDGVDTGKKITVRPEANSGETPATYTENYYTLTLVNSDGISEVSEGNVYLPGTEISIEAAIAAGYEWLKWDCDEATGLYDGDQSDLTSSTTTITMPAHPLALTAYAEYMGTYSVSGKVIDDQGNPIPDAVLELWLGSEKLDTTSADENGLYAFATEHPEGKYNIVIKTKDENNKEIITTTVIEIDDDDIIVDIPSVTTLENTVVIIDENAPPIVVGGLPDLLNVTPSPEQDGVTKSDKDNVKNGGKLELVFRGEEFAASSTEYKDSINKLMNLASLNDSIIGLYLNLNMTKYVWTQGSNFDSYEAATETTPLLHTSELITVYTPIDDISIGGVDVLKDKNDLLVYRSIEGNSEKLGLGAQNANQYGEYYEITDNIVVLHTRNFGEYAIAYQDQALCKASVTVNKDTILWTADTPSIILRGSSDHVITNNTTVDIPGGTYKIIVRGEDTGKYITINPALNTVNAAMSTVDYYTLTLNKDDGIKTLGDLSKNGIYLAGTEIAISAVVSSGYIWENWTASPIGDYGNLNLQNTTIKMPAKALTLTAATEYTGIYTVGGIIEDEDKNPIGGAEVELWYGDECLDTTTTKSDDGTFVFDKKHPSNKYNIIIKVKDDKNNVIITTTVIEIDEADYDETLTAITGLKNTQRKIEETPITIIEGLPELLNTSPEEGSEDDEIVSSKDAAIIADGGKLEILFVAKEFTEEDLEEYKVPLDKLMSKTLENDRIIGLLLELNVTKYVWEYDTINGTNHFDSYDDANSRTPLSQLPALVTISLSIEGYEGLENSQSNTLKIYRYHAGNTDEIYEGETNKNIYGEYFEHNPLANIIVLHVRRFSEYAITYQDRVDKNVSVTVNKDGSLWVDAGQITLVGNTTYPISSTPTLVPGGTYKVYRDDQDTGKYVTISSTGLDFTLNYYTLTVNFGSGISSTTGTGIYLVGDQIDITALVRSNHIWNGWSSNVQGITGLTLSSTTITMPSQPLTLTANAYNLSGGGGGGGSGSAVNIPNIIVKDTDNGTVTYNPSLPTDGTKVTITIKPDEGYTLDTLVITDHTGQEISYIDNGDGTYTYIQPVGTAIVNAGFVEMEKIVDDTVSEDITEVIDEIIDETIDQNIEEDTTTDENIDEDDIIIIDDVDETPDEVIVEVIVEEDTSKVSNSRLDNEPRTGDNSLPIPVIIIIAAFACLIELLLRKKQKSRI